MTKFYGKNKEKTLALFPFYWSVFKPFFFLSLMWRTWWVLNPWLLGLQKNIKKLILQKQIRTSYTTLVRLQKLQKSRHSWVSQFTLSYLDWLVLAHICHSHGHGWRSDLWNFQSILIIQLILVFLLVII